MQPKQTNEKKSHNLPSTLTYKGKYFFYLSKLTLWVLRTTPKNNLNLPTNEPKLFIVTKRVEKIH